MFINILSNLKFIVNMNRNIIREIIMSIYGKEWNELVIEIKISLALKYNFIYLF